MADQAQTAVNGKPDNAYVGMRSNLTALLHDSLRLGDLQLQLLEVDIRDFWMKARLALIVLGLGAGLVFAALPVAMFGLADYLARSLSVTLPAAQLLISGCALMLAVLAVIWAIRTLSGAGAVLQRSRGEFQQNMAWFRSALHEDSES